MDILFLREAATVVSFATFIGIIGFALAPRNQQRFGEAARLPLDDEGDGRG